MSELAQRIIASHKAAAKRAVFHLNTTHKLKMSSTESLELVACVLGVANWQTLLAMAKEGTGPRIDESLLTVSKPLPAEQQEKSIAQMLANYYGTTTSGGEHPHYPRTDWAYQVENGENVDKGNSYWQYVEGMIDLQREMLPWKREQSFAVKLARIAGMNVLIHYENKGGNPDGPEGYDLSDQELALKLARFGARNVFPNRGTNKELDEDESEGWDLADPHGLSFTSTQSSESEMWEAAALDVRKHLIRVFHLEQAVFENMSEEAWLTAAQNYFVEGPKATAEEQLRKPKYDSWEGRTMLPGELSEDDRKSLATAGFCQALQLPVHYSEEKSEEGKYWVAGFQFYPKEIDAWYQLEMIVRNEVISATGMSPAAWLGLDVDARRKLAIDHSLLVTTFNPIVRK